MSKAAFGAVGEERPTCVTWRDEHTNETGYRIELHYFNSGETFTYGVEPDVTEFIFPLDATEGAGAEAFEIGDLGRQDWAWSVTAVMPDGSLAPAGGGAVQVQ